MTLTNRVACQIDELAKLLHDMNKGMIVVLRNDVYMYMNGEYIYTHSKTDGREKYNGSFHSIFGTILETSWELPEWADPLNNPCQVDDIVTTSWTNLTYRVVRVFDSQNIEAQGVRGTKHIFNIVGKDFTKITDKNMIENYWVLLVKNLQNKLKEGKGYEDC